MANITTKYPGSLLSRGDLYFSSNLLSPKTVLAIAAVFLTSMLWQLYQRRKFYRGLPGPPHSLLFGHLPLMISATSQFPPDAHSAIPFAYLMQKYNLWDQGLVYIDTYPLINEPTLIVAAPESVSEIMARGFKHHPFMTNFYGRIIGLKSMTLAEGEKWKAMRKTFNPSFGAGNIMGLMPDIVEQGEIFASLLSKVCKNGGFVENLDKMCRGVTIDIIFRVVLGLETATQLDPDGNEVVNLLEAMGNWMGNPQSLNPLRKVNVARWVMLRWYERRIKKIFKGEILKRWESMKEDQLVSKTIGDGSRELKIVIDLALKQYRDDNEGSKEPDTLNNDDLDVLADNIKSFIFGGHDTTASTIAWAIYELSRNPDILEQVRQEHTGVFGPDLDTVPATLLKNPHLINQLPLTVAVIKETLRLYPPASALRLAEPGATLTINSTPHPLTSQLLYISHPLLFRSPLHFPSPNTFLPHRFLPPSHPIDKSAYRPFERGPRACIGQELALLELKTVLLLTLRRFTFRHGYEELALRRAKTRRSGAAPLPIVVDEVPEWGGPAYIVSLASNKPKDGIPVWVTEEGKEGRGV